MSGVANGRRGPLLGVRILEIAGLGPVPYCGMMLADMGADVVTIERVEGSLPDVRGPMERGRRVVALDLKAPEGIELLLRMVESSQVLFEGYRPGVAERLGFGPDECLRRNPRLVYGRVTGWGRDGPLAAAAGHDLNYLALTGLLHAIGPLGHKPTPPLNVVGDFGGGGLLLAFGILCALLEVSKSGRGQVVDASMIDGVASFLAPFMTAGQNPWGFDEQPGAGLFGGAAPYYEVYETSDGRFITVAALERQFYGVLVEKLGVDRERFGPAGFPALDAATRGERWPALRSELAQLFRSRTQRDWCALLEGTDACFAPVLPLSEAVNHPHHRARGTFVEVDGVVQPAPAPRFSRTHAAPPSAPRAHGADTHSVLLELGLLSEEIQSLQSRRIVGIER